MTGWSLEYIDDLDLPEVWDLYDYFDQWPPMHMLMRVTAGYKPPPRRLQESRPAAKPLQHIGMIEVLPPHVRDSILVASGCKTVEEYKNLKVN